MKDTQAARAKQKRRLKKEAERRKYRDEILSKVTEMAKQRGVKTAYSKEAIWKAFNGVDRKLIALSVVYSVIAVAYVLRKSFGFGRERLIQYIKDSHKYINVVGKQVRDIPNLKEELKIDAGIDCENLFNDYKPFEGQIVSHERKCEGQVMLQKMNYIYPMAIYTMYFDRGWKQKRMSRLICELKKVIIGIIERNEIENIKKILYEECNLKFYDDGRVLLD